MVTCGRHLFSPFPLWIFPFCRFCKTSFSFPRVLRFGPAQFTFLFVFCSFAYLFSQVSPSPVYVWHLRRFLGFSLQRRGRFFGRFHAPCVLISRAPGGPLPRRTPASLRFLSHQVLPSLSRVRDHNISEFFFNVFPRTAPLPPLLGQPRPFLLIAFSFSSGLFCRFARL